LKSGFLESKFQKTNMALVSNDFFSNMNQFHSLRLLSSILTCNFTGQSS
jgi:hypothetical protein